ncbi:MAG: hypothetical protein ACOCUI_05150 [bacterium]
MEEQMFFNKIEDKDIYFEIKLKQDVKDKIMELKELIEYYKENLKENIHENDDSLFFYLYHQKMKELDKYGIEMKGNGLIYSPNKWSENIFETQIRTK